MRLVTCRKVMNMIDINFEIKDTDKKQRVRCYNSENVRDVLVKFGVTNNTIKIIEKMKIVTAADFKAVSLNRIEFYELLEDNGLNFDEAVAKNLFKIFQNIGSRMDLQRTLGSFKN